MNIVNSCYAPNSFIVAIEDAFCKSQVFAKDVFEIERQPSSKVFIINEDNEKPKINERYSGGNLFNLIERLSDKIEELLEMPEISEISDSKLIIEALLKNIRELLHIVTGEENSNSEGIWRSIVREINSLMDKLKELKQNANENSDHETEKAIDKILDIWDEIFYVLPLVEYPYAVPGLFRSSEDCIYLCYRTICDSIGAPLSDEYGAYVFAHEYFHAIHYLYFTENARSIRKWDSSSQPAHIRRSAVKESLAEYFAHEYANRYLSSMVATYTEKIANSHHFPNWGYAGARLFERFSCSIGAENSLFNGVFHASIIDIETAYRLFY